MRSLSRWYSRTVLGKAAIGVAVVGLIAGCAGGGTYDDANGVDNDAAYAGSQGDGDIGSGEYFDVTDRDIEGTHTVSVIEYYLAPITGWGLAHEDRVAHIIEDQLHKEELIALCMRQQGFEYIPNPPPAHVVTISDGYDDWPRNRQFAQTYGFGFFSRYFDVAPDDEQPEPWINPNDALLAEMTPQEQQEWQRTLWGHEDDHIVIYHDDGSIETHTGGGCWHWAHEQTNFGGFRHNPEFDWLFDAMFQHWDEMREHPAILDAHRDWSECMASRGHFGIGDPFRAVDQLFGIAWPPSADALDFEIELALAHVDCRIATNWEYRVHGIRYAAERQFVEDHRAAFAALRLAAEQGQL